MGYAGRELDDLVALLLDRDVRALVDVRRFPKSKYPCYNREELEKTLRKHGIRYVFLGDYLGGFRGGYERYMNTRDYREGIGKLMEIAEKGGVAIMCRERKTKGCHRRYICRTLREMGVRLVDIE